MVSTGNSLLKEKEVVLRSLSRALLFPIKTKKLQRPTTQNLQAPEYVPSQSPYTNIWGESSVLERAHIGPRTISPNDCFFGCVVEKYHCFWFCFVFGLWIVEIVGEIAELLKGPTPPKHAHSCAKDIFLI